MKQHQSVTHIYTQIAFAALATLLVLGPLLMAGYVLLLDWTAGPLFTIPTHNISGLMQLPSNVLQFALHAVLPGWLVQKVMLVGIVFAVFYLPLRFYPWTSHWCVPYVVSILAACNPFVYERLLSGQWRVVLGYACMYPLMYYILKYKRDTSKQALAGACVTLVLTAAVSIHFFAIGLVVLLVALMGTMWGLYRSNDVSRLASSTRQILIAVLSLGLVSLYWIIPFVRFDRTVLDAFSLDHFLAFATVRDETLGVVGNVLSMRGFWLEDTYWAQQFVLPGSNGGWFYLGLGLLAALVLLGARQLYKSAAHQSDGAFLLVVALLSVVFASGVSAAIIWPVNLWLLENVSLWGGFRDTQKWAGMLVVVYGLLAGAGLTSVIGRLQRELHIRALCAVACVVPILLVPSFWFGFAGQVHTVWYPDSWLQAAAVLEQEGSCRALFLPWQQYYTVDWNNDLLTANPATKVFPCDMVTGHNTNIGTVAPVAGHIAGYTEIEQAITRNATGTIAATIDTLRSFGVTHIIVSDSMAVRDVYEYPFLVSSQLTLQFEGVDIRLYRID